MPEKEEAMRHKIILGWVALSILSLMLVFPLSDILPQNHNSSTPDIPTKENTVETFGKLPLLFIQNQGQLDEAVEYYLKAPAQTLYFTKENIIFDLSRNNLSEASDTAERLVFSLDFLNANSQPTIEGTGKDSAVVNYFVGNDPEKWRTGIPTYTEVVYHDIYPAVDLRLRGKGSALEYDFVVRPGARPEDIRLAYNGIDSLTIENSELVIGTAFGNIKQEKPYIYQQIADETVEVAGGFSPGSDKAYGFYVAAYNDRYPLVIDPTLAYSTYLGGSGDDEPWNIAVDTSGCAYVTGRTDSSNFPTQNPYRGTFAGICDAFVAKIDTTKSGAASLIYSTYLGGSEIDEGYGIAVDAAGCAYVTGDTVSHDFPIQNPYQPAYAGSHDAFVTKLSATGNSLIYSTYLGSNGGELGNEIAVDATGCAYITGETWSGDFPTLNAYQWTKAGPEYQYCDAFVTKLSALGNSLIYSTYLGGSHDDRAAGIAVDSAGCAYITGNTFSTNFPTQNAFQLASPGIDDLHGDIFVTRLSSLGNSLIYSTYLGGTNDEHAYRIAVDASGCAYVVGYTSSSNFPTRNAYQPAKAGAAWIEDAFVSKVDTTKIGPASLIYSTYLGGTEGDVGFDIAVDAAGCAYITGQACSDNFPTQNPLPWGYPGNGGAFVAKLDTSKSGAASLIYSTYLSGSNGDVGRGIALDAAGGAYVTGSTGIDFPTQNPYQAVNAGRTDAFVAKLVEPPSPTASVQTATGTGTATFTTSSGYISGLTAMATTGCGLIPPGLSFPHGFFSFTITGIPAGSTVTLTITFPSDLPADAKYFKCSSATGLVWLVPVVSIVGNVMTIQLTDGGVGDLDGVVNGIIVDPGGPALSGLPIPLWILILILLLLLILMAIVIWVVRFRRPAWWTHFKKPK